MFRRFVLSAALVLGASLTLACPATAMPNQPLAAAQKTARAQKAELMGVVYVIDKAGKVKGESWNSEMKAWDDKTADRLRTIAVGPARKLKKKEVHGQAEVLFTYTDGTTVKYNKRRGKILTMDILSPGFTLAKAKDYKQVMDWKEAPYQGKKW